MQFVFRPMTEADAHQIASWHYPPPYDFYDFDQDPEDLAALLDPQHWQAPYYAVFRGENELIGFFSLHQDAQDNQIVEIGLGLRPDLTGRGLGLAFLQAGLAFAQQAIFHGKMEFEGGNL